MANYAALILLQPLWDIGCQLDESQTSAFKTTQKPAVMDAAGQLVCFLAPPWKVEILRVKGGIGALRVGFRDFALNP